IITSLDDRGYLPADRDSFAAESGISPDILDSALSVIGSLDPAGCGASSARECLLIQAKLLYPEETLLHRILDEHFENLSGLFYGRIARALSVPEEDIISKSRMLHGLDPYPGRQFSQGGSTRFIIPDVDVKLVDGEILVTFNDEWIPRIGISSYYSKMLSRKGTDKKLREYIREKVTSARMLQRNIYGWRETIEKIVIAVMRHQIEFLEHGPGHLKPLTHALVAEQAQCHESTVSRATTNKFIQCSWGIFELKEFFVSKIKSDEEGRSSDEVLCLIRDIVAGERTQSPYSDDEIVGLLERSGVTVARRTVAKYRDILNIPSSGKRKRLNILKAEGTL
ncbi:MAG: RNA polymerase factor sigma-54, partial [Spirochaetota bacterium]